MFIKFPSIEAFDRIMINKAWQAENAPDTHEPEFILRPKIKLHGTNGAFGAGPEGAWAQSRTQVLGEGADNWGSRRTLLRLGERLLTERADFISEGCRLLVFGEWAGQGVQKNDAVTLIGRKAFFPFALAIVPRGFRESEDVRSDRARIALLTDPGAIMEAIGFEDPDLIVLPWAGPAVRFSSDDLALTSAAVDSVNALAERVGESDPFIREEFGVNAPGEGLVFMPVAGFGEELSLETFANLTFKAKAERHRVKATARAASVRAEIPESAEAFADAFVTEARMEQMLAERLGGAADKARTGDFVRALVEDVMKESGPERSELGVPDKILVGLISKRAASWFVSVCENEWRLGNSGCP